MKALRAGEVPDEIKQLSKQGQLSVGLSDKRGESFYKNQPKKKPEYFKGKGVSLSGGGQTAPVQIDLSKKNDVKKIRNLFDYC